MRGYKGTFCAGAVVLLLAHGIVPAHSFVTGFRAPSRAGRGGTLGLCMAARKSLLTKTFKKPTGALTVSMEYRRKDESGNTEKDLRDLSMQLRKGKAAALWTSRCDLTPCTCARESELIYHTAPWFESACRISQF
jgi:hypothetical protein